LTPADANCAAIEEEKLMENEEGIEEEEEEHPENEQIVHGRGNMTEASTSMEVDGIEYPLEKCQRRLNSALQKGQMERAKKWMERIDDGTKIGQIITEMNVENMTKLVGMANRDIGISKKRYKLTGFYWCHNN
jgi:hypothetical protein